MGPSSPKFPPKFGFYMAIHYFNYQGISVDPYSITIFEISRATRATFLKWHFCKSFCADLDHRVVFRVISNFDSIRLKR